MSRLLLCCVLFTGAAAADEPFRKAADEALQLAESQRSPEHYQQAAELFEKAHLVGMAIQSRERLRLFFPDSPLARAQLLGLARDFEKIRFYRALGLADDARIGAKLRRQL
jgi:hypothetical protein